MAIEVGAMVMVPAYAPYPRFGRVAAIDDGQVHVVQVQCGDPRCMSEHRHADQTWHLADLEAAETYQPRASWEEGRRNSYNAPVIGPTHMPYTLPPPMRRFPPVPNK